MARLLAGFAVTMGNPKAMLFYLALLPSLVRPEALQPSLVMALFVAVVVVLAAVFAVYVFAAHKARAMMLRGSSMRMLNRVTASALGGAAAWIASR
jgi:threonine/homoserine/homoserine lactone efflux protein